jgi:hypothetical protein
MLLSLQAIVSITQSVIMDLEDGVFQHPPQAPSPPGSRVDIFSVVLDLGRGAGWNLGILVGGCYVYFGANFKRLFFLGADIWA